MSTLAKILAGGLPGGAVAGKAEIIDEIRFANDDGTPRAARVAHPGTFNANPLSAAAGAAALPVIATGEPHRRANEAARQLAVGMNAIIRRHEIPGCVYGHTSIVHILLGEDVPPPSDGFEWTWEGENHSSVPRTSPAVTTVLRRAMINEGIDLMGAKLIVGGEHSPADVELTLDAFDRALGAMQEEGAI
jgi:glutamate-1-semialdehyde 2,1-aminomutase